MNFDLDPNWPDNRKAVRLCAMLGPMAHWHVVEVWLYAHRHFLVDGVVGTAEDVEAVAKWSGQPGALVTAMLDPKVRLLDKRADGTLEIHNWKRHMGAVLTKWQEAKETARIRAARWREAQSNGSHVPRKSGTKPQRMDKRVDELLGEGGRP